MKNKIKAFIVCHSRYNQDRTIACLARQQQHSTSQMIPCGNMTSVQGFLAPFVQISLFTSLIKKKKTTLSPLYVRHKTPKFIPS